MIIRLPDLDQAEDATLEEQLEKVVEEMHELKNGIACDPSLKSQALLSEALDVIQATAGFLALQDKNDLLKAMKNHTNKLKRKYRSRGYTMLIRREYRRD